jgi:hypothetical protein
LAEREREGTDLVHGVEFAVVTIENGEELLVDVWIAEFLDFADVLNGGLDELGIEHLEVGSGHAVLVVWWLG